MSKIFEAMRRDRLYILLLVFIILVNVIILLPSDVRGKAKEARARIETKKSAEDLILKRDEVERVFYEKRYLALLFSLMSLLILFSLVLGIVIDIILISSRLRGKIFDIASYKIENAKWNVWDVGKVVILFLFFGYIIVIIESLTAKTFPLLKNNDFRMILNSSILDILTVVFILYFTIGQYRQALRSLGISLKNFSRNVFYGIVGYIAAVPVLVALLVIIAAVANIIKYVPEKQPVVELFLREKDIRFLTYTSIFAAVVGPIIEELFFRGFMYSALKKYIGVFWSMVVTAAVFATFHTHIVGFLPIMALGILLAYLYERTGTLVSSITVHTMHNFGMLMIVFLVRQVKV